jgi:hypothetical protein
MLGCCNFYMLDQFRVAVHDSLNHGGVISGPLGLSSMIQKSVIRSVHLGVMLGHLAQLECQVNQHMVMRGLHSA